MSQKAISGLVPQSNNLELDAEVILNGLNAGILLIDSERHILKVNTAAEHFLSCSAANLIGSPLSTFIPFDSPIFVVINQVFAENHPISEHDVTIETPRIGRHFVNINAMPIAEKPGVLILAIHSRSVAEKIDRQLYYRGAARSVSAMASMLAHEVKNPLSGIRGAAQLLEISASKDDQNLTRLIRDEVDRICALVDRMDIFNGYVQVSHKSLNIHQILDHVLQIAKSGFGHQSRFTTHFDPSLPPIRGDRDQLIQVFLNLIKNAVEASPDQMAEIILSSAYLHGIRFGAPGDGARTHLPIAISITDNGSGISDDLMPYLFDPFVTSKPQGSGLGLAIVAKIIADHGGVVECHSAESRTTFRIMLPVFRGSETVT